MLIYTNTRGEIILFLVTKRKIPAEFDPIEVTFDDSNHGKMAVINNIIVVEVGQSQKAWCSSKITSFFTKTCLFEVPPLSTICNYDKARGHLDVCVKAQIEASGRVPLETAAEISKHTQANDLFVNAAFQTNLRKVATKFTINQLLEARVVDGRQEKTTEDDVSLPVEFEGQIEVEQAEQEQCSQESVNIFTEPQHCILDDQQQPPADGTGAVRAVEPGLEEVPGYGLIDDYDLNDITGEVTHRVVQRIHDSSTEVSGEAVVVLGSADTGDVSPAGSRTHVSHLLGECADFYTTAQGDGWHSDKPGVAVQDMSGEVDGLALVQAPELAEPQSPSTFTAGGLSNLSLKHQVDIIAEAASMITHRQILGSYERSGMWLATDGSEDHKLSSGLKEVIRKAGQIIIPSADFEQEAIDGKSQVSAIDEENDDVFDLSKLFQERRNMVMRKQVIDDKKSNKKLKAKGTDKSFKCSYCGKVYVNYYSAAAKSHDFERGGACPKESLETNGISVPTRDELLCQNMFFRGMDVVPTEVIEVDEDDDDTNIEQSLDDEVAKVVKLEFVVKKKQELEVRVNQMCKEMRQNNVLDPIITEMEQVQEILEQCDLADKYYGILLANFKCPSEVLSCLEAVIGDKMFYHLVESEFIVEKIKSNLVTARDSLNFIVRKKKSSESDFSGLDFENYFPLIDVLDFDPDLEDAMMSVFGQTFICRNSETAEKLRTERGYQCATMNLQKPPDYIRWYLKYLLLEEVSEEMDNIINKIKSD